MSNLSWADGLEISCRLKLLALSGKDLLPHNLPLQVHQLEMLIPSLILL